MTADLSLSGLHAFLSTHTGRDQVGNFVGYFTQMCAATIEWLQKNNAVTPKDPAVEALKTKLKKISVVVGDARRTVRWFSSLGIIIALRELYNNGKCAWTNKWAFAVANLALLWWHVVDHYRWLVMNQIVTGDSRRLKNVSFTGFVVSSGVSLVYFLNKLLATPSPGALVDDSKEKEIKRSIWKHAANLVATLHISELWTSHEIVVGAAGSLAAAITIQELYPKKKKD